MNQALEQIWVRTADGIYLDMRKATSFQEIEWNFTEPLQKKDVVLYWGGIMKGKKY